MKSKIILSTIIIFTLSIHTTNCMKRCIENASTSEAKRIKHQENSFDNWGLYFEQEYLKSSNQDELLKAIAEKDICMLSAALNKQSRFTFLDWTIATKFWHGMHLILQHGKPTQPELRRSLEIAIKTNNIPLIQGLLMRSARLDMTHKTDQQIKKVLHENPSVVDLLITHGLTFIDAINMDLTVYTIESIIKKKRPKESELDWALEYINEKQHGRIWDLLIAEKKCINDCF